jgi:alpha-galactosidase
MSEKIVLIGAGSAMFTQGVLSDLIRSGIEIEMALVDIDPSALDVAYKLAQKMVAAKKSGVKLTASTDRTTVLPGATVVITTIGVGGRRAWERDVYIPRKYGLNYPVGDTVGPGGTSRALRMVPPMVDIARDVLKLAPNALFFNYANPMAVICRAIRKATPANVTGLCIGTFHTWHYLAHALKVKPEDLTFACGGINHMTWFWDIRANGQDAMPALYKLAAERLEQVNSALKAGKVPKIDSPFGSSMDYPFSWQCLTWFGAYPSPQDRHITEFFPVFFRDGKYYGKTLGVDEFSFEGTIASGDQIFEEMGRDALNNAPLPAGYFERMEGEQEQVVDIIQSIRGNHQKRFFANLPNQGQVPNLPLGVIVEAPAVTDANGIHAIQQPPMPTGALGVLATRYQWVEMVVEAALEGSRVKFIEALVLDGAVKSADDAVKLADELLHAQRDYLPLFRL